MGEQFSSSGPSRRMLWIILAALLVLAGVGGFRYAVYLQTGQEKQAVLSQEQEAEATPLIAVHVIGAVEAPGLYWLESGSRVNDALNAAGGAAAQADLMQINLAAFLIDGSQLVVPYLPAQPLPAAAESGGEAAAPQAQDEAAALAQAEKTNAIFAASDSNVKGAPTAGSSPAADGQGELININTASSQQLQALSGIGEVKAQAIIDYRETNGDFAAVEHITRVSGIGPATFDKIRDNICVQ